MTKVAHKCSDVTHLEERKVLKLGERVVEDRRPGVEQAAAKEFGAEALPSSHCEQ